MIAFLSLLLHVVVSPFKTKAQLEAEIIMLRHQLNVLRQRVPSKPKLTVADRRHCHVNGVHSRQGAGDRARHPVAAVAAFHTSIASRRTRRRVGRLIR
jgi:hypothetical protein